MWYGRIRDLNIWKEDSRHNRRLTDNPSREIQYNNTIVTFYMGSQLLDTDISMLNLSVRAYNCLRRMGWNTIGDMLRRMESWQDLLKVRNLGRTSAMEIMDRLIEYQESILTSEDRRAIATARNAKPKEKMEISMEDRDLSELKLSNRSYNSLKRAGYNTVGEVSRYIRAGSKLQDIRNLGATSEREILTALETIQTK